MLSQSQTTLFYSYVFPLCSLVTACPQAMGVVVNPIFNLQSSQSFLGRSSGTSGSLPNHQSTINLPASVFIGGSWFFTGKILNSLFVFRRRILSFPPTCIHYLGNAIKNHQIGRWKVFEFFSIRGTNNPFFLITYLSPPFGDYSLHCFYCLGQGIV